MQRLNVPPFFLILQNLNDDDGDDGGGPLYDGDETSSENETSGLSDDSELDDAIFVPDLKSVQYCGAIVVTRDFGIRTKYSVVHLRDGGVRCVKCGLDSVDMGAAKEHAVEHSYLSMEAREWRQTRRDGRESRVERHLGRSPLLRARRRRHPAGRQLRRYDDDDDESSSQD
jgi:hypothetical protein